MKLLESCQREAKQAPSRGRGGGGGGGRGMMTRRAREVIETEKFTEARLETLYSKPTTRSPSNASKGRRGAVAKQQQVESSESSHKSGVGGGGWGKMVVSDRQTRNTPSKMEARSSAQKQSGGGSMSKQSSASKRNTAEVIVIEDDTPVKKSRKSLQLDTSLTPKSPDSSHTIDDKVSSRTRNSRQTIHQQGTPKIGCETPTSTSRDTPDTPSRSTRGHPLTPTKVMLLTEESRSPRRRRSPSISGHSDCSNSSGKGRSGNVIDYDYPE